MTIRNVSALATAIAFASHTHAAFDPDSFVFFAYDAADDDTYFVDLNKTTSEGVTFDYENDTATLFELTDAGLASFLASNPGAQWTILGAVNDPAPVSGPPAVGQSYTNRGIISTSTSGNPVATTGSTNETQRLTWLDWLADIKVASGGSSSFGVAGTDPVSSNTARNEGFFDDSLIALGANSTLWYAQAEPSYGALLSDPLEVSLYFPLVTVGVSGNISASCLSVDCGGALTPPPPEVPLPATAWLFFSAIGGLFTLKHRAKNP